MKVTRAGEVYITSPQRFIVTVDLWRKKNEHFTSWY